MRLPNFIRRALRMPPATAAPRAPGFLAQRREMHALCGDARELLVDIRTLISRRRRLANKAHRTH